MKTQHLNPAVDETFRSVCIRIPVDTQMAAETSLPSENDFDSRVRMHETEQILYRSSLRRNLCRKLNERV